MLTNAHIADTLELVADLLEFQGANAFRVRAYRNGARAIRDLSASVAQIVLENPAGLLEIDGVGTSVAEKCTVLVRTGSLPQLESLREEIPDTVLDMLRIPGLGPKKASVLYRELGVTTLAALREACELQRVRTLKGFGARTEALILNGLRVAEAAAKRYCWCEADETVQALTRHLETCADIERMRFAGSYRRGKETVGDLDLLVLSSRSDRVMDCLERFAGVAETLGRGDTKMSVRMDTGLQIDLRVVPRESFGAAWQYFTGSKDHNVELRRRAKQRGLKINEYGVFRVEGATEHYLAGQSEEEVYGALDLPVFPPEIREARFEFRWAEDGPLPRLVEEADILGDLHMHTTATDGTASVEAMAQAARQRGLKYIAITDHSQRVAMVRGLTPDRLLQQWACIDRLNAELAGSLTVLKGVECDILERGGLDLPHDVLAQADWVVASIHFGHRQPRDQITARILEALAHPYVSAIAHPTGRAINYRDSYDVDMEAVLRAASVHGKFMELNANPSRLDLDDVHCAAAKELGVLVVINTDAHSGQDLALMRHGVQQARRGGLTRADVANTRAWDELKPRIGRRR